MILGILRVQFEIEGFYGCFKIQIQPSLCQTYKIIYILLIHFCIRTHCFLLRSFKGTAQ